MNSNQTSVLFWLSRLSTFMDQFQSHPTEENQAALLFELSEYQKAVQNNNLQIPRTIPAPLPEVSTMSEWYRKQMNESLSMFKISPLDDRMHTVKDHTRSYREAVSMKKVKP